MALGAPPSLPPTTNLPTLEHYTNKGVVINTSDKVYQLSQGNYQVDSLPSTKLEEYPITPGVKVSLMEVPNKPGEWSGVVTIDPTKVPTDDKAITFTLAGHRYSQDAQGKVQPNAFPNDINVYKGLTTTPFDYYTNDAKKDPFINITGPKTVKSGDNVAFISKNSILCDGKYLPFISLFVDFGTPGKGGLISFPITVTIADKEGRNIHKNNLEKQNPGVNASLLVTGEVNANSPVKKKLFGKELPTFRVVKASNLPLDAVYPNPVAKGESFTVPNLPENEEILRQLVDVHGKTIQAGLNRTTGKLLPIGTSFDVPGGQYFLQRRCNAQQTGGVSKVTIAGY